MKKVSVLLLSVLFFGMAYAGGTGEKAKGEINWITFEEAEKLMQNEPRHVLVDVYTNWCGWCKVMDKKTYTNPDLINYINEKYYAIKFNAEQKEIVHFVGKEWVLKEGQKTHDLAIELLQGRMSYPSTVIMEKGFKSANPVPGYLKVPQMESILRFFGDEAYKTIKWEEYQREFKGEWKE